MVTTGKSENLEIYSRVACCCVRQREKSALERVSTFQRECEQEYKANGQIVSRAMLGLDLRCR